MTTRGARHGMALLLALFGFGLLSVGDGIAKSMSGEWPGTAIAMLRYVIGAVGLAIWVVRAHGTPGLGFPRPWVQVGRGVAVAGASLCLFTAVQVMPQADATAIQFSSPMITALLSWLFLRERMSGRAWVATVLAFAGVLVVLRPQAAHLGIAALLPLAGAAGMSVLMMLNRMLSGLPVARMQWTVAATALPILIVAAMVGALSGKPALQVPMPDWTIVARCAAIAVTGTMAHLSIYLATTRASAVTIAPTVYIQLLVAVIIGWAAFGNRPDMATMDGAALIVLGGVILWRGQKSKVVLFEPSD